jgi:hypothetical protein
MHSYIPGFEGTDEPYGVIWAFWSLKHSSLKLSFSAVNSNIKNEYSAASYYPIWNVVIKFMTRSVDEVVTYNFIIIASFVLSGVFMFCLVYYCCKNVMAGVLSGLIYAFCPYHFARAWQHMSLSQIQWFPLYILAFLKLHNKVNIQNIVFCIIAFSMFVFTDYYYTYFCFLITIFLLIFIFLNSWKKELKGHNYSSDIKFIKAMLLVIITVSFITTVLIFPVIKTALFSTKSDLFSKLGYVRPFNDLFEQSARPLSYLLPATVHPVFGSFTERFIDSPLYGASYSEHALYLGWIPLFLAFIAFRMRKNKKYSDYHIGLFVFLGIISWFFSQPPWWKFGTIKIYMPSFFMYKFFPMFRAYCRFGLLVVLAIAALAGFGLAFILGKLKTIKAKIAIGVLLSGLVAFEFWNYPPFKVIDVSRIPLVYYWIKKQPGDFAIADYPLDVPAPSEIYKFFQTKHEKRIINGAFPGTYANKVNQTIAELSSSKTASVLKWLGVKYVLVHKDVYLKTELIEQIKELNKIPKNPGLKFIKSFPPLDCTKDVICIQEKTGPIDVYEVVASPVRLELKENSLN